MVYTLGFSTRDPDQLLELLRPGGVSLIVDIRSFPRSRHTPQWNREALEAFLPTHGFRYHLLRALGGFRKPRPDSSNLGWRNASFRGYADYMETPAFEAGLAFTGRTFSGPQRDEPQRGGPQTSDLSL